MKYEACDSGIVVTQTLAIFTIIFKICIYLFGCAEPQLWHTGSLIFVAPYGILTGACGGLVL